MSLIGPGLKDQVEQKFIEEIPYYKYRTILKPGSGWAQVNYPYGASLEDTVKVDIYYINHIFLFDLLILCKTIKNFSRKRISTKG